MRKSSAFFIFKNEEDVKKIDSLYFLFKLIDFFERNIHDLNNNDQNFFQINTLMKLKRKVFIFVFTISFCNYLYKLFLNINNSNNIEKKYESNLPILQNCVKEL